MEKTIKIAGLPVFYREEGEGETILILHGWASSSQRWVRVQNELVRRGFRVVVPDLPGFGKTPEPPQPWDVSDYTRFVRSFVESKDLHPRGLVGHSFGGRIAILYAVLYGKELPGLVLISAAGIFLRKTLRVSAFLVITKMGNLIFSLPVLSFLRPLSRKILYRISGEHDYYNADGVMRETFKKVTGGILRPYLPLITVPTLILWGSKDLATPISDARILHEEIPVSHLVIFPNGEHALNIFMPEKIAKHIHFFLGQ